MFEPEKATVHLTGCESYTAMWEHGHPMPEGWGTTPEEVREGGWITTEDYDRLVVHYREAVGIIVGLMEQDCRDSKFPGEFFSGFIGVYADGLRFLGKIGLAEVGDSEGRVVSGKINKTKAREYGTDR